MLGRAANNMFWMARNMERAESVVRLVQTSRKASLLKAGRSRGKSPTEVDAWQAPLRIMGQQDTFVEDYGEVSEGRVMAYLITDRDNLGSIHSLIGNARENARATRHMLTTDVWECINRTWLTIKDENLKSLKKQGIDDHLDWMIDRSYTFKGALRGSMRRGEALQFCDLGLYLERADYTARFLAGHFKQNCEPEAVGGSYRGVSRYYNLTVLLNALNAYKAYRETFANRIEEDKIAELLILHQEVPRSLRANIDEVADILRGLNPNLPVLKEVYDLQYRLQTVQISHLRRVGLDHFLTDFSAHIADICNGIEQDFMMVQ